MTCIKILPLISSRKQRSKFLIDSVILISRVLTWFAVAEKLTLGGGSVIVPRS